MKDKIIPVWETPQITVYLGDCLKVLRQLPDESVNCCVTSPPYFGLRDYKEEGQIGLETTLPEYVAKLVAVFGEIKRVLKVDGTCWLNLGDSYSTHRSGKCDDRSDCYPIPTKLCLATCTDVPWHVCTNSKV